MRIALIGLPQSGRSTLFSLLVGHEGRTERSGVQLGTANVPDPRLDLLSRMFQPKKTTYARLELADLPPLDPGGGSGGQGMSLPRTGQPGPGLRILTVCLLVAGLLAAATPQAGAVSSFMEVNRGQDRLVDSYRSNVDGMTASFDVPLETTAITTALSLAPGTEFRLVTEANRIPADRDPSRPASHLLRAEAWAGLSPWPVALGLIHQAVSWQWATDGADEQIPFEAAGWGLGLETRLAVTNQLAVGASLRATPWARWTDETMNAMDPHRLFFLGYDLQARYFLSPTISLQAGYRADTLRAVAFQGAISRDVTRSGFYGGLAIGF